MTTLKPHGRALAQRATGVKERISPPSTMHSPDRIAVRSDGRPLDEGSANSATSGTSRRLSVQWILRVCINLVGAGGAAVFAYSFLHFFIESHRPIGIVFFTQQTLVAVAYLIRRPARSVTRRLDDWVLAFVGTFVGVLFRPAGAHPAWGVWTGNVLQLIGASLAITCLLTLGRSFGFAAADRDVVTRGPYAIVRHPMYAAYFVLESGYLLQSLSVRNAAIVVIGTLCNAGRALAEERLLAHNDAYQSYRRRVRRRIVPGVW